MSADDASTRPSKRARHSSEQNNFSSDALLSAFSLSDLERHPEFWFDDGNIILVAQHTGFRIYRGLLAAQSTIFADMFATASAAPQEALDECPVVHLTDSSYDLAHLLRVLLPTSPTCYRAVEHENVHSFDEIFAVVRLAHKYNIQSVQEEELRALQEYYLTGDFDVYFGPPKRQISMDGAHYIGAVNLARLTDTPGMLPLALYHCCYLGGKLLDAWTREDGSVERLSDEDVQRCVDARRTLGREELIVATRLFDAVPRERCKERGRCALAITKIALHVREGTDPVPDALLHWSRVLGELKKSMCEGCLQVLCERDKAERRRVWNALPQMLGITVEGWGTSGGDEDTGNAE